MHTVTRTTIPRSLQRNADKWTRELLLQLNIYKTVDSIPHKYTEKYRKVDIKEALCDMYNKRCCYCEGKIGAQSYEHIEHLKPKSLFPQECYEWNNLHWVCEICNSGNKNDKWDRQNPILDPTNDVIENFIDIDLATGEIIAKHNNARADVTIEHAGLNRKKLVDERKAVIKKLNKLVILARNNKEELIDYLKEIKEDSAYISIYDKYIQKLEVN